MENNIEAIIISNQLLRNIAKTLSGLNQQVNQLSQMVKEARIKIIMLENNKGGIK